MLANCVPSPELVRPKSIRGFNHGDSPGRQHSGNSLAISAIPERSQDSQVLNPRLSE